MSAVMWTWHHGERKAQVFETLMGAVVAAYWDFQDGSCTLDVIEDGEQRVTYGHPLFAEYEALLRSTMNSWPEPSWALEVQHPDDGTWVEVLAGVRHQSEVGRWIGVVGADRVREVRIDGRKRKRLKG